MFKIYEEAMPRFKDSLRRSVDKILTPSICEDLDMDKQGLVNHLFKRMHPEMTVKHNLESREYRLAEALVEDFLKRNESAEDIPTTFYETPQDTGVEFESVWKNGDYAVKGLFICGNSGYQSFGNNILISIAMGEYEDENTDGEYDVLEKLKEVTGKTYAVRWMTGYEQSEWQYLYYPEDAVSEEEVKEIEMFYMGKYTYWIDENSVGIVVPHEVELYSDDTPVKEYLAKEVGISPENVVLVWRKPDLH